MRFPSKFAIPSPRGTRQILAMAAVIGMALGLPGCGQSNLLSKNVLGDNFAGGAVADEPRAALAGHDVLVAGGTAADAAVTIAFTLSVTLPSSAGLGGGGSCLVWDRTKKAVQLLDLPRSETGEFTGPGLARLMFALHARYGRQQWAQVVAPAENLARFPSPISRAFAREIAATPAETLQRLNEQKFLLRADGRLIGEGEPFEQIELAALLGQIRQRGAGILFMGPLARDLAAASNGAYTVELLNQTLPRWRDAVALEVGSDTAYFTAEPPEGGGFATRLFQLLTEGRDYGSAAEAERPHLLAEAMARAWGNAAADPKQAMAGYRPDRHDASAGSASGQAPASIGSTGFLVADKDGLAIACTLSMNAPFGAGRLIPGFGFLAAPRAANAATGAAMMWTFPRENELTFALASGGGASGAAALDQVALGIGRAKQSLVDALKSPRVWQPGDADTLYVEPAAAGQDLARRGHRVEAVPALGSVNALFCSEGFRRRPDRCQIATDPRGNGIVVDAK